MDNTMNDVESAQCDPRPDLALSPKDRGLIVLTGILLPPVCFLLYFLFRNGHFSKEDGLGCLLAGFSAVCAGLLVYDAPRFMKHVVIRFGIYSGIPVSLIYAIANGWTLCREMSWIGPLFVVGSILVPWGCHRLIRRKWHGRTLMGGMVYWVFAWMLSCVVAVFAIMIVAAILHWNRAGSLEAAPLAMLFSLFFILMCSLAFAPFWTLLTFVFLSARLWRHPGREIGNMCAGISGVAAWTGAYAVAWRAGVTQATEIHRALNPGCFVATAAARGHRRFVGSWPTAWRGEPGGRANRQLVTFKCFELAMRMLSPAFYRVFRKIYDTCGYPLSRLIVHPVLSDMVFVLLKPPEWGARFVLRVIIPDFESLAANMYPIAQHAKPTGGKERS